MSNKVLHEAQPAFVLHSYAFRETSLIVELFSRDHGRVALVARGARRPKSALRGVLLAFQPLTLTWGGRGELKTLHRAEWQGGMPQLQGMALMCGFYLNELLVRLLPRDDPHENLFEMYRQTLQSLCAPDVHAATLRRFEKHLLKELGYAMQLETDADSGHRIEAQGRYVYLLERGPVAAGDRAGENRVELGTQGGAQNGQIGQLLDGQTLLDMARDDYSNPTTLQQSKALMRLLINHHLNGQALHTRQLLKDMQQL
jgi:DNA repair protein RecO (recombination protein O)